jgi:hypothetical protein
MPPADLACEVCSFPDDEEHMLLCDFCNLGWHMYCLEEPLVEVPKGSWLCPTCLAAGVTYQQLQQEVQGRERSRVAAPPVDRSDNLFKFKEAAADKHALAQEGRLVLRVVTKRGGRTTETFGVVHCRDPAQFRPHYYEIAYDDGTSQVVNDRGLRNLKPLPKGAVRPEELAALHQ